MKIRRHRVDLAALDDLGSGTGSPAAMAMLRASQLSKHLLLLRSVLDAASERDAEAAALHEGFELLQLAEARVPGSATELVRHPHVGAWAFQYLRTGRVPDLGYLAALGAVAAFQAGARFTISVPTSRGILMLPTLGRAVPGGARASVASDGERLTISAGGTSIDVSNAVGWQPLHRLWASSIDVLLDDMDPFRCHAGLDVATRLTDASVAGWRSRFGQAWTLLSVRHPSHATAMAGILRSVVPLRWAGRRRSATCPESFGAVAASCPPGALDTAAMLVHEFQHMKLGALLDLVPLCEDMPDVVYYAPWRDDPRPATALLHGVYAHLGVAGFWREHRHDVDPAIATRAQFEFALWREQSMSAARQLGAGGALTRHGERFVTAVMSTLDEWLADPVPASVSLMARERAEQHRIRWCKRNIRPLTMDRPALVDTMRPS